MGGPRRHNKVLSKKRWVSAGMEPTGSPVTETDGDSSMLREKQVDLSLSKEVIQKHFKFTHQFKDKFFTYFLIKLKCPVHVHTQKLAFDNVSLYNHARLALFFCLYVNYA